VQPVILPSAHRHRVAEEDMLHAYRNAFRSFPDQGDHDLTMLIGFASNGGQMLEIGVVEAESGERFIVHAMQARPRYL